MITRPIKDKKTIDEVYDSLSRYRNGKIYKLYVDMALATGLRVSEILKLKKKDIVDGMVILKMSKNDKYRNIRLNDGCKNRLEGYLALLDDNDRIFNFSRQYIHKIIKESFDYIGYEGEVGTHTLRKTAAWFFYIRSGKDIVKTRNFLGHDSIQNTLKYLLIEQEEVNDLLQVSWFKE